MCRIDESEKLLGNVANKVARGLEQPAYSLAIIYQPIRLPSTLKDGVCILEADEVIDQKQW